MQPAADPFDLNRVILCHFDSYSTALVFARWSNRSLLLPTPLPEGAQAMAAPAEPAAAYASEPVLQAVVERYQIPADDIVIMDEFNEWLHSEAGPVRVHLLRFTTFEAPAPWLAPFEGVFKPISELRGSNPTELLLLRQVFNLIITGGGQQR
jgi:hypothetical protein